MTSGTVTAENRRRKKWEREASEWRTNSPLGCLKRSDEVKPIIALPHDPEWLTARPTKCTRTAVVWKYEWTEITSQLIKTETTVTWNMWWCQFKMSSPGGFFEAHTQSMFCHRGCCLRGMGGVFLRVWVGWMCFGLWPWGVSSYTSVCLLAMSVFYYYWRNI